MVRSTMAYVGALIICGYTVPVAAHGADCNTLLGELTGAQARQVASLTFQNYFNLPACQGQRTLLSRVLDPQGVCNEPRSSACTDLKRQAFWLRRACEDTTQGCLSEISAEAQDVKAAYRAAQQAGCIGALAPVPKTSAPRSACGSFAFYPLCDALEGLRKSYNESTCDALLEDAFFAMCDIGQTPEYAAWMNTTACQSCLRAYDEAAAVCDAGASSDVCRAQEHEAAAHSATCDQQPAKCAFYESDLFAKVRSARAEMQRLGCDNVFE